MTSQDLTTQPGQVNNLHGNLAKGEFVTRFKEVQRLRTQFDQYTDLDAPEKEQFEALLPTDDLARLPGAIPESGQRAALQAGQGR